MAEAADEGVKLMPSRDAILDASGLMLRYLRVGWLHDHPNGPVLLYSEIQNGFEVRKIAIYRSGHLDYADDRVQTGSTHLSETAMPSIEEIASNPELLPAEVDADVFEQVWRRALLGASPSERKSD